MMNYLGAKDYESVDSLLESSEKYARYGALYVCISSSASALFNVLKFFTLLLGLHLACLVLS